MSSDQSDYLRHRAQFVADDSVGTPVLGNGLLFVSGTVIGGDEDNPTIPPFTQFLEQVDEDKDGKVSLAEGAAKPLDPRNRFAKQFLNYRRHVESADTDQDGFASREEWENMRSQRAAIRSRRPPQRDRLVAIRSGAKGDATETHVAWDARKGIPDNPSPLYNDGHVYLVKSGGIVSCFKAATGEEVYRKRVSLRGNISASPVVAGGNIYAFSENGQIVVLRAGPSGDVLAKGDLKERIMATPAMVDGKIYVRTDKQLYAFGG